MKKSILFAVLTMLALGCMAQTKGKLRTIVFADTYDGSIGAGVRKSLAKVQILNDNIATALEMDEDYEVFDGTTCSRHSLMQWLNGFRCSADDVVIFYYLGHGGRSQEDTSIFPQMCLNERYQSDYVSLEAFKQALVAKGPRFCLVIADCCNSIGQNIKPKYTLLSAAASSEISDFNVRVMKHLFLDKRGCVTLSGSKKGEYSWIDTQPGTSAAGVFIDAFIAGMEWASSQQSIVSWESLVEHVSDDVASTTINGQKGIQHPEHRIEWRTNPHPDVDRVIDTPHVNQLKQSLEQVANDRRDNYHRLDDAKDAEARFFAPNAAVRVVGRDGSTLILKVKAADYLSRIATTKRLSKITILREKHDDNGKVTELTVHETYLKK